MSDATWASLGPVLSTSDLMRVTGMKEVTVWRWLKRGTLPGHVISGSWIVYREEVRAKIDDPEKQPLEPVEFLSTFDDVVKIEEAELLFGKTRQTIYKWLSQGAIPGHQMGVSWVLYRDELRECLVAASNQSPSPAS